MRRLVRAVDYQRLFRAIRELKPEESQRIVRDYRLDLTKANHRRTLVHEYVAKEVYRLSEADTV